MSIAVDTNVILELVAGSRESSHQTQEILERESRQGGLVISPPVYAECLAHPGWVQANLDGFLKEVRIAVEWELPRQIWVDAGLKFAEYSRRRRGVGDASPRRLLADFIIGAHGVLVGKLLTYDNFFRSYFPDLEVVDL